MKLAEALKERADLNLKIAQLKDRIISNSLMQEGEAPVEDPELLISELDAAIDRLEVLMGQINMTNSVTRVGGVTLTALLAKKDCLAIKLAAYRAAAQEASQNTGRARFSEIKILPAISVSDLQAKTDTLSKELRELDNTLQANNWTCDLIEE